MVMGSTIGIDEFMSDIYDMVAFTNNGFTSKEGEYVWEESYKGIT